MDFGEIIAYRVNQAIRENTITPNRLADLSELSQTALEKITKGETKNPSLFTLASIARGLGMTVSEFLDFPEMNELDFRGLRKFKKQMKRSTEDET